LLNTGESASQVSAAIPGHWTVRDLWQHTESGTADGSVSATVQPHSAVLLRLSPRA